MSSCCKCQKTPYGTMGCCETNWPWQCGQSAFEKDEEASLSLALPYCDSAERAQTELTKAQQLLSNVTHMPTSSSCPLLLQLIYLTKFADKSIDLCPYTKLDALKFTISYEADKSARCWLRFGLIGGVVLVVMGCLAGLSAISEWKEGKSAQTSVIISATCATAGTVVSWISTGSNPDFASNAANDRQDCLSKLGTFYEMLAVTLVDLNATNKEIAKKIAESIDLSNLKAKLLQYDPKTTTSPDLSAIEAAICYTNGTTLPERVPTSVRTYIALQTKESKR